MNEPLQPHWLQRLGLIDAPEGTVLRGADFALRGLFPVWVAVLLLVLLGAAAVLFYRAENAKLGMARRGLLAGLRTLLFALVLLLLMRPVLLARFEGDRKRPVVLLVDTSQSMAIADRRVSERDLLRVAIARGDVPPDAVLIDPARIDGLSSASRLDIARMALDNDKLALLRRLEAKGPVEVMLFDLKAKPAGKEWLADLKAEGTQTALADCVHGLLSRQGWDVPTAVVVVTDGRDTASIRTLDEAGRACGARGVALHVWGVG
ncbi:MAG: hypothetical protein K2W96_10340, partial [Gemmataceae bacterium]|nr:hypothetical protein [Gemmataceae bacterium]